MKLSLLVLAVFVLAAVPIDAQETGKIIRIGIIGCDTSHVPNFTGVFNDPKLKTHIPGFKVVAAYKGGSPDLKALSVDRVDKFAAQIQDRYGVELVNSIEELLAKVDVVLLESVDGRVHWQQATPVLKAKKRVFIDKPLTASLADAVRILQLSKETGTPVFSCSSLRYSVPAADIKADPKVGGILGALTYGSCSYADHHPDMAFYGVHGLEMLYALMGPGCKTVSRAAAPDSDIVTGVWSDGRIGTYRGIRKGKSEMGALVFGKGAILPVATSGGYDPMLKEIAKFFRTGVSPVPLEETVEIMAVIDAADESKRLGGAAVSLDSLFQKARAQVQN